MATTRELFNAAVEQATRDTDDGEGYWECVWPLHERDPREVWELVVPLVQNPDHRLRALVADVLRFLGKKELPLRAATLDLFRQMLREPQEPIVLSSIGCTFVDLGSGPEAIEMMAPLAGHQSEQVRRAVVSALLGNPAPEAIATLIRLSSDASADVRNWATFGLGSELGEPEDGDVVDTPELRAALIARLSDSDEETRAEAVVGLGIRMDERVVTAILAEFEKGPTWPHYVEASRFLASPALCAALKRLKATGAPRAERPWDVLHKIDEAIAACCQVDQPEKRQSH